MEPFEELNKYHEYKMSGGDSENNSGSGGNGCFTVLVLAILLYFVFSGLRNSW